MLFSGISDVAFTSVEALRENPFEEDDDCDNYYE